MEMAKVIVMAMLKRNILENCSGDGNANDNANANANSKNGKPP